MFSQLHLDRIRHLQYKIQNKEEGTYKDLIQLWETLPRNIWHYYNATNEGFDNRTWTACLMVISKWERFKKNNKD